MTNAATGVIDAFGTGVKADPGTGTVTNFGAIIGGGPGIALYGGGVVNNLGATALIQGEDAIFVKGGPAVITNRGSHQVAPRQ